MKVAVLFLTFFATACFSAEIELIRDPHFLRGFHLLEPSPGKRVPYGIVAGIRSGQPLWDLAQWSSKSALRLADCAVAGDKLICSNEAKQVLVSAPITGGFDISLAVDAGVEYSSARKSSDDPWVHLLVQQDFSNPPSLGELGALEFHVEALLKRSRLVCTNDYSPALHAAQFFVYFTVANTNPDSDGYQDCFWFGIPIYDNRERFIAAYEAQDFGATKLFIFTPSSMTFTSGSTHDFKWLTFQKDILPNIGRGLQSARTRGFIKGDDPKDFKVLGVFIGWEVPGMFDVELQLRNLSLKARKMTGKA